MGMDILPLRRWKTRHVLSFTVSQREREIGVRMALGAGRREIAGAIVRQFARPITIGMAAGAAAASGAAIVLSRELFGLSPVDPLSHAAAALLFLLVSAAATMPSLRRACRVDPMSALRHE